MEEERWNKVFTSKLEAEQGNKRAQHVHASRKEEYHGAACLGREDG